MKARQRPFFGQPQKNRPPRIFPYTRALQCCTVDTMSDCAAPHEGSLGGDAIGLGDKTNRDAPVRVDTANDWVTVSAGINYTLAIKTDGSLWAWGKRNNGFGGDDRPSPARMGMADDWATVKAGNEDNMAIKSDGSLWAWGTIINGCLGIGDSTGWIGSPVYVSMGAKS